MVKTGFSTVLILGALFLSACGGGSSDGATGAQRLGVFGHPADLTSTDVCVVMTASHGAVGGLQMDLSWNPACMTAEQAAGNAAPCASNPSTGKSVETKFFSGASMRTLFLSLSDTNSIPDGELFCCGFTVARSQDGSCCSVNISSLILASPGGGRVYDPDLSVQVLVGGAPCVASVPGAPT
jgi:aspartate oxidase